MEISKEEERIIYFEKNLSSLFCQLGLSYIQPFWSERNRNSVLTASFGNYLPALSLTEETSSPFRVLI